MKRKYDNSTIDYISEAEYPSEQDLRKSINRGLGGALVFRPLVGRVNREKITQPGDLAWFDGRHLCLMFHTDLKSSPDEHNLLQAAKSLNHWRSGMDIAGTSPFGRITICTSNVQEITIISVAKHSNYIFTDSALSAKLDVQRTLVVPTAAVNEFCKYGLTMRDLLDIATRLETTQEKIQVDDFVARLHQDFLCCVTYNTNPFWPPSLANIDQDWIVAAQFESFLSGQLDFSQTWPVGNPRATPELARLLQSLRFCERAMFVQQLYLARRDARAFNAEFWCFLAFEQLNLLITVAPSLAQVTHKHLLDSIKRVKNETPSRRLVCVDNDLQSGMFLATVIDAATKPPSSPPAA